MWGRPDPKWLDRLIAAYKPLFVAAYVGRRRTIDDKPWTDVPPRLRKDWGDEDDIDDFTGDFDYSEVLQNDALNKLAADWARKHAGELVKGIDATTQREIGFLVLQYFDDPDSSFEQLQAGIVDLLDARKAEEATAVTEAEHTAESTAGGAAAGAAAGVGARAYMISRTETALAANAGNFQAFRDNGTRFVMVHDGTDYDEECADADGQIWTLDYADANSLEHPNCGRNFDELDDSEVDLADVDEGLDSAPAEEPAISAPTAEEMAQLIQDQGGFSIDPETGSAPEDGFMVSIPGHSLTLDAEQFLTDPSAMQDKIDAWLAANADQFEKPGMHIGGWLDNETGQVVLDPSQQIADQQEAIDAGVANDQKAIYDVANGQEIPTGGTGGMGAADDLVEPTKPTVVDPYAPPDLLPGARFDESVYKGQTLAFPELTARQSPGMTEQQAQEVAGEVNRLAKQMPLIFDPLNPITIEAYQDPGLFAETLPGQEFGDPSHRDLSELQKPVIAFNSLLYTNPDVLDATYTKDQTDGWIATEGTDGIVDHEVGHIIDARLGSNREMLSDSQAWANAIAEEPPPSKYATSNTGEWFAECVGSILAGRAESPTDAPYWEYAYRAVADIKAGHGWTAEDQQWATQQFLENASRQIAADDQRMST